MFSDHQNIDVIILAGGLGTRLRPVISDRPKVLAPVGNRTLLDYVMEHLFRHGLKSVILSIGHMKEKIIEHIHAASLPKNISVVFSEEDAPLGTGGAIKKSMNLVSSNHALILNGDTFFPIDYSHFIKNHLESEADISIGLRHIEDISQSGEVLTDSNGKILGFNEKTGLNKSGLISGGVYIFKKDILEKFNLPEVFSIEKDFFEKHIQKTKAHGLVFNDYFIDIGIPENYEKAQNDLKIDFNI